MKNSVYNFNNAMNNSDVDAYVKSFNLFLFFTLKSAWDGQCQPL